MTGTAIGKNGNGEETAIVLAPRAAMLSPYEPGSYEQALAMATTFAQSGLCKVQTAAAAYMVMATGRSLGIPPETALRTFHVIDGIVTLPAQIMVALCLRQRDLCEYFDCIESDANHAVYETKRAGRAPMRESYSLDQAKQANLLRPGGNWAKDPQAMCRARASSRLVRIAYPDIIAGLYTMDEIRDGAVDEDPPPRSVAPLAPSSSTPAQSPVPPHDPALAAAATAAAPIDGEAQREERFAAALRAAKSEAEGLAIGNEISAAYDKDAPPRKRLLAVFKACKKGGWAPELGAPPADPAAEATREPGQEG